MGIQLRPLIALHADVSLEHSHTRVLQTQRVPLLGKTELTLEKPRSDDAALVSHNHLFEGLVFYIVYLHDLDNEVSALDVRFNRTHFVPSWLSQLGLVVPMVKKSVKVML